MQIVVDRIKQVFCVSLLSLAVISFAYPARAVKVQEVPNPQQVNRSWVSDAANLLTPQTKAQLNQMISDLEVKNGSELVVVTVPQTVPSATPKEFATSLFNYWKIGKKGQNNGVLLLISKGDRRVEIETGYGVEGILPDALVGKIINREMTPRFKQNDFDGGTLAGIKALVVTLQGEQYTVSRYNQTPWYVWVVVVGGGAIATVIGLSAYQKPCPVFIEPEGRSQIRKNSEPKGRVYCNKCQQPMKKLDSDAVRSHLSKPQQVAQDIGSVKYEIWQCTNCSPQLMGEKIHLRDCVLAGDRFSTCPTCQELTMKIESKVLEPATQYREGRRVVTYSCQCCPYSREVDEIIPRLPPPPPPSSSYTDGGGSFGGGDSGGGGAGGSW